MTNQNQDPNNQNPNPDDGSNPNPDDGSNPSDELKPLTDEEMADMTTEEITAHAEKLEAQIKDGKKQTPDQIRDNQIKRAKKAQERAFSKEDDTTTMPDNQPEAKSNEIAQADLLTLGRTEFEIGSEEQVLLQERIDQGVIKTYSEGLNEHVGVMAEIAKLTEAKTAAAVIDENDPDDVKLRTKKEAVANAKATGEIPDDPAIQEAIVEDNLSNMSALK